MSNDALHKAASEGNVEMCKILVDSGAKINSKGYLSQTALHFAIEKKHCNVVDFLINKGADTNALGYLDRTPLHYAAINGDFCSFMVLAQHEKTNFHVKDHSGLSVLHYASMTGDPKMCKFLIQKGVKDW